MFGWSGQKRSLRKRKSKIVVRTPATGMMRTLKRVFSGWAALAARAIMVCHCRMLCSLPLPHAVQPAVAARRRRLPLLCAVVPWRCGVRQWREFCRNFSPLWVARPAIPVCSGYMAHLSTVGFSILPFLRLKAFTAGKH